MMEVHVFIFNGKNEKLKRRTSHAIDSWCNEAYIKTHLLEPLEMHDSTFLRAEVAPDLAVTPHLGMPQQVMPGAYPYHRGHAPSSTLHSSVQEMCRWAIANLNRGRFQDRQILQPASHNLLWQPTVQTGDEGWEEAVGLSWFFGHHRAHPIIHHGGNDPGFEAHIVFVPAVDVAAVVLTNANAAANGIVTDVAVDLLLGLELQTMMLLRNQ